MRVFRCTCPDRPVLFFENVHCGRCQRLIGFCTESMQLKPFVPAPDARVGNSGIKAWADDDGYLYVQCRNWTAHAACNWMIPLQADPSAGQQHLCRGCRLNEIIPDLTVQENVTLWRKLEIAKRRCLYSLLSLGLPVGDASRRLGNGAPELAFRFLADRDSTAHFEQPLPGETPVLTGHQDGVITINLAEADDIARTRMRIDMEELYRTLLGHFRHETGHYYWDVFRLADARFQTDFRAAFGDETQNYADAVQRHYAHGPAADWQRRFVSSYAAMHPWEDWAETWAHYLHIIDTLQTRQQFGEPSAQPAQATHAGSGAAGQSSGSTSTSSRGMSSGTLTGDRPIEPVQDLEVADFNEMMSRWIDTSIMLNSLNRSMGLPDPYPFVLNREVKRKLRFVDTVIRQFRQSGP